MSGASAWLEAFAASGPAPRTSMRTRAAAPRPSASARSGHLLLSVTTGIAGSFLPPESKRRPDSAQPADRFDLAQKRRRARSRKPFFGGGAWSVLRVCGVVLALGVVVAAERIGLVRERRHVGHVVRVYAVAEWQAVTDQDASDC